MDFEKRILGMEHQAIQNNMPKHQYSSEEMSQAIESGMLRYGNQNILFKKLEIDGQTIYIPKDYKLMAPDLISRKYPYSQCADFIFTDREAKRDFCYQLLDEHVLQEKFKSLSYGLYNSFRQVNPKTEIFHEDLWSKNEQQAMIFDFSKATLEEEIYLFMAVIYSDGVLSLFSFSSPLEEKEQWYRICTGIVQTIKNKE